MGKASVFHGIQTGMSMPKLAIQIKMDMFTTLKRTKFEHTGKL